MYADIQCNTHEYTSMCGACMRSARPFGSHGQSSARASPDPPPRPVRRARHDRGGGEWDQNRKPSPPRRPCTRSDNDNIRTTNTYRDHPLLHKNGYIYRCCILLYFARFATTAAAAAAVAAATNIYQGALVVSIAVPSGVCTYIDDCIMGTL